MDTRSVLGRSGEDLATRSYERDGYTIVARNFRCGQGEVDIIAARGRTLVFCEVKTRSTDFFGDPVEAVGRTKQARLRRLAAVWLGENPAPGMDVRFDVVSIIADPQGTRLRRLEDAF